MQSIWFQSAKAVVWWLSRRVPPFRSPIFSAIFGALIIVFAWMIIPILIERALQVAYLANLLDRLNLAPAMWISFACAKVVGTVIAASFWARSLELCYPDTFDPYHEKHR